MNFLSEKTKKTAEIKTNPTLKQKKNNFFLEESTVQES